MKGSFGDSVVVNGHWGEVRNEKSKCCLCTYL